MQVVIREYRASDYSACRSLNGELARRHAEVYEDPSIAGEDPGRGLDKYLALSSRRGAWVVEVDGRVVGFTGLLENQEEEGVVEIEPLVVSAAYRGKGIGSKLVEYVKDEAKALGFRFITVKPELRNEEAFKLYVSLGFNLVGGVELFQDLSPEHGRTWKSGVEILGQKLEY
ncbi:MAG: GNAT family N-acetyltransferase [Dehalococcoidales bacterium]|jgi:GNAT superfamily N-acetyltransferase